MKKKGFTLLEIVTASTLFFLMMVSVLSAYMGVLKFKYVFQAKASILENTYYMMEKINVTLKDYNIDYDEYFNRAMIGCDSGYQSNFTWNVGTNGYCDAFTFYGNGNAFKSSNKTGFALYYCSSATGYSNLQDYVIKTSPSSTTGCTITGGYQSFGQYALLFYDQKKDSDADGSVVSDSDDLDIGNGPLAIPNATGVQELYLISPDKKNRIFLRRTLVTSGDWNQDGVISGDNERWYTIQILKLKGFDAGTNHDFAIASSSGVYDGKIDTWACDYSQGFICNGTGIGNLYSGYRLPLNVNDGRINLFDKNLTVANWNLKLFPTKHPSYSWFDEATQLNPYFTIYLKTKLYSEVWQPRLKNNLPNFELSLQTTFDIKDIYSK